METIAGTIVVIFVVGIIAWAVIASLFSSIADNIQAQNPPSKIKEHQEVTFNGKVIVSCYFVPYLRGETVKWKKIHIKSLSYTTPEYTKPFSRSTKCVSFEIATKIINHNSVVIYHGLKLYPILVYDKNTKQEDVVYYCKKYYYPFNKQYLVIGSLEDCQKLIDDIESLGTNTRHVIFNHYPQPKKP